MKHYGMFTENGNRVSDILTKISAIEGFEEANDTAVRESVYLAMESV